ncbi:hypothetical protein HY36_12205 [Hyphomonas atlantica]|uniref:Uncharacterized protein n=2 Tax=Hyphomonas atlantica TaxID=1280948 RepID=A0A059EA73_9PROT|nr:hypothetical protein HY36_12205 [Hyphomonas atlantica]
MMALADELKNTLTAEGCEEQEAWNRILADLANGDGLEEALGKTNVPSSLIQKIVERTWLTITADDLALLQRAALGEEAFPLSEFIRGLFRSTNNTLHLVTPNYDRVAEYAVDVADHFHGTGFVPGLIRRREGADGITFRRGNHPARVVRIWKVHGSLDWFQGKQGQIVSLPLSRELPAEFSPMIVTPGVSKYERTHDEPFRSAIQGADLALGTANSVLCIGYGFRDRHIQPKLVERCRQKNVPLVVLARTLTDETKEFLRTSAGTSYLALESCEDGTRAYTYEIPNGAVIENCEFWSFAKFNDLVL